MGLMKLENHFAVNKTKWKQELISKWESDSCTDFCLDEWYAYKMWVYNQGEEYFISMKEYLQSNDVKERLLLEELQHDSWVLYLEDLGMDKTPFGYALAKKIEKADWPTMDDFKNKQRGIA